MDNKTMQALCNNPDLRLHKEPGAAAAFLLAASEALSTTNGDIELTPRLREVLAGLFREAAIVGVNSGDKQAADVLAKGLGFNTPKGTDCPPEMVQAARNGATKTELAEHFNVGKNKVPEKLAPLIAEERDQLEQRLSHTVGRLLRLVDEVGPGAEITEVTARLRGYLTPQFRLLTSDLIDDHIQNALRIAKSEELIRLTGITITRLI
ncbi:hypothetical protein P7F88_24945 [Vibrio hannami]|uniref:hypothetical protein n=1 Tax=Vibrio hannami TaxID=2717094 RepID=UPI00241011F6|nr:hypothetical protein [Vibrio hannami]MDG3089114.1 hypothetical protein [Vibrio hannami]